MAGTRSCVSKVCVFCVSVSAFLSRRERKTERKRERERERERESRKYRLHGAKREKESV
jgi:hypothetical protein